MGNNIIIFINIQIPYNLNLSPSFYHPWNTIFAPPAKFSLTRFN